MEPNAGLKELMNERIIENIMQLYFDDDDEPYIHQDKDPADPFPFKHTQKDHE